MDLETVKTTFAELLTSLQRLRDAEAEIDRLKTTVNVINERVQSLIAENDNLKHELYSVVAERDHAREDCIGRQREIDRLHEVVGDRDGVISGLRGSLQDAEDSLRSTTAAFDDSKVENDNLKARLSTLEDQLNYTNGLLNDARSMLDERISQLSAAEAETRHWQARFNAVNAVLDSMKEALSNIPAVVTSVAA
jgi:chromosome segregation ATPase